MATEYRHNGVVIMFESESGKFGAVINESLVWCASLAAVKKKIDAAKVGAFEPFDAYVWRYGNAIKVRIVGVAEPSKRSRYRNGSPQWVDKDGQTFMQAYPATDETKAWMDAYDAMKARHGEEDAVLRGKHTDGHKGHAALVPAIPMPAKG